MKLPADTGTVADIVKEKAHWLALVVIQKRAGISVRDHRQVKPIITIIT
jgi:hypothetical protein